MAYNPNAFKMPALLTGRAGEVSSVVHWPLRDSQVRRLGSDSDLDGATDCLIHFDKIKAGGTYNARRVHYNGRFFIKYYRAPLGRVFIGGALVFDVLDVVTRVYWRSEMSERESEALAARVQESS